MMQCPQVKTGTNSKFGQARPVAPIQSTGMVTPDCTASGVGACLSYIAEQKPVTLTTDCFLPWQGAYISAFLKDR